MRVFLAVDHQAMLARRSELGEEFEIVATVGNGHAAGGIFLRSRPVGDGYFAAGHGWTSVASFLQASQCRVRVVFLTIHEDPDFFNAAFSAGALGCHEVRLSSDLI
ncbi:response regulator transcription factor [Edaphobacter modestus]|uniref:response regulator transcription factor n=1 Tax=Edaphobacter modestus TaxID=388466 RepID=UPI00102AD064|nr:response regulator transcription factor [Edaphobacter modestus]